MTWQIVRRDGRLEVSGELRADDAAAIWRTLRARAASPGRRLDLDLAGAHRVDGAIVALLVELRASLAARGVASAIVAAGDRLEPLVRLYQRGAAPPPAATGSREHGVARLGAATEGVLRRLARLVDFAGELTASWAAIARRPAAAGWRRLPDLLERTGADGVPIVILLDFLVGLVIAYQAIPELRMFGANVFVADVVGVSITRELAPLMTAIIVAGRSGAAFAAELGAMRVSDEIDALRTMGFAPVPYLVLPRVIALALAAPVLALVGDVVGVAGGMVVAASSLDVTPSGYLAELRTIVVASDVWTGLVKSVAFGIAIALIGCRQGLSGGTAAAGVGRGTTTAVVHCLFAIVLLDTLFTVVFRGLHA